MAPFIQRRPCLMHGGEIRRTPGEPNTWRTKHHPSIHRVAVFSSSQISAGSHASFCMSTSTTSSNVLDNLKMGPRGVQCVLAGSGRVPWRLIKAQVAVAMAVIRSRPPGVSGRQHGEALGRTLRRQDGVWRERAQALQEEVLRLRQELLVSRATANTNSSRETADEAIMEDLSQDLFGPGSPAFGADPPPDCDSETPDFLLQDPPFPFPLPLPLPLPPPPPPSRLQSDSWSDSLLPHMRFLQSLCSLQRLDGSSVALAPEGHGGSAASETIFLLLDSVAAACGAPPPPGLPDLLPQACRVASRALDLLCSGRPSADLQRCVEEALRELTRTLLHSQRPGRAAEKLTESLVALGSSSVSKSFLVCLILSEIGSLAEQLWQTSQGPSRLHRVVDEALLFLSSADGFLCNKSSSLVRMFGRHYKIKAYLQSRAKNNPF
ncbi:meiosis-specific protein MEI4 isoform X2 [Gambusia affinis]|uniref:meiosis-specific protein MEI4 isoform X2 n=1 Tax=Gambusia affinis TaxID=33528 RepID=UPI001CDCD89B|nr:meiosis-specific protein MEI4 isoform X2 [Gambusia affinis]